MMASLTRIVSLLMLAPIAGCGGAVSDPEKQVRAWVDAMQVAAEEKARRDIVTNISPAYVDTRGNSRNDIDNLLRVYFLRQNKIALLNSIDEISVINGSAAEVSMTVAMAGTNNSAFGISADAYRFELELEHDGDDWRLISARWGELGEQVR